MSIDAPTRLAIRNSLDTRGDSPRGDRPNVPPIVFGTLRADTAKRETTPQTPDESSAPKPVNNSFGPDQTRPEGDYRNAQQIIADSGLLKNLGDQHGSDGGPNLKEALKKQVGDFETDADAAYRAVQVLEHVEKYDEEGDEIATSTGKNPDLGYGFEGNQKIDGFTKSGDAKNGTEAGRLQDFGKYGYDSLKGGDPSPPPPPPTPLLPLANEVRPTDDTRSAAEIIDANPTLKNLGNQEDVKDNLKKQVGDFEHDADAAYRASQVIDYIKNVDGKGQGIKKSDGNDPDNDKIDGFSFSKSDGRVIANPNTEAGRLQDFGKNGYESLKGIDGKGANALISDLSTNALVDAVKAEGGDPDRLGADYFATGKTDASPADKTAALIKLSQTLAAYTSGQSAYQGKGGYVGEPVQDDGAPSSGQQREAFVNDVQAKIEQLGKDPDVQKFQSEKVPGALHARIDADPSLKTELQRRLDAASSTSALESAFAAKDNDGNPVSTTDVLRTFISQPNFYGQALDAQPKLQDALKNAPKEIQDKVRAGYDEITSGDKLKQSIDSGTPADKAVIDLAVDKSTYDAVLDQKTVDEGSDRFDDVITKEARGDVLNGLTPDDLLKGLGATGADDPALESLVEKNLDSLFPSVKERPSSAVIVSAVRGITELMRQGATFDSAVATVSVNLGDKLPKGVTDTYKTGVIHAASGLLLVGALATRSATGTLGTNAETATQSFLAAGLLVQGGSKFVRDQMSRANAAADPAGDTAATRFSNGAMAAVKDIEFAGKGLAVVGNVLGLITGSIAASKSAAKGDKVAAGFQGTFAGLSGLAATAGAGEVAAYIAGRAAGLAGQVGAEVTALVVEGLAATVGAVVGGAAAVGGLIYLIVSSIKAEKEESRVVNDWFDGVSKDFASFGITPPDISTTLAPKPSDDPKPDPVTS